MKINTLYNSEEIITALNKGDSLYQNYDSSEEKLTWCGGCGNYKIQNALKRALTLEGINPRDLLLCFDVGCNGNGSDKMHANTIHGLHGRVLGLAAGCALGNTKLKVIASAGDGATFSEGVGHLVHAVRSDYPFVFLHHNNNNYGLTTGQASSTTPAGFPMNGAPDGVYVDPLNPLEIVLSLNPSFVARTFSGDTNHLTATIRRALNHKGFAFVEILQVCPTYNKATPQTWYWDRIKHIEDLPGYDNTDLWQAKKIVEDLEKDIYIGVLYDKPKGSFLERLPNRKSYTTSPTEEVIPFDINPLLKEFE